MSGEENVNDVEWPLEMMVATIIGWWVGGLARIGERDVDGKMRAGIVNAIEVGMLVARRLRDEPREREVVLEYLGTKDPLREKIGDKAADDLLAGRAAVVPLTGVNPSTGQPVVLDELVYANKKTTVYTAADRVRLDLDGVRIDAV